MEPLAEFHDRDAFKTPFGFFRPQVQFFGTGARHDALQAGIGGFGFLERTPLRG